MKLFRFVLGLVLLGALIALVQLAEPALDSPAALFQRLPDVKIRSLGDSGNAFEGLASSTVADSVLYGDIADQARSGALDAGADDLIVALNNLRPMASVFPPADATITLTKAARHDGALNDSLTKQLRVMLAQMTPDPKSGLAVEKFKDNFMPLLELSKRCRTWGEFQQIVREANSPEQLKVLTKMAASSPAAAQRLSAVLLAAGDSRVTVSGCLDYVLHQGPKGLETLYAAIGKGATGLRFVIGHPGFVPGPAPRLSSIQETYQSFRYQYGPVASAGKYLAIAVLCGCLVLVAVPGRYLEKLLTRPGSPIPSPTPAHYFLSALAVGVVLAGLVFLLSLAIRPAAESTALAASGTGTGEATAQAAGDSALLSGFVVSLSLAIHAFVWFFVRGKIRLVEDDEAAPAELRLRRLENLDVFLDLPLFTGLALTVCAFILITLNAGMSRHFAYTATVVGILSSVSLRIRYQYPLKERLIHMNHAPSVMK